MGSAGGVVMGSVLRRLNRWRHERRYELFVGGFTFVLATAAILGLRAMSGVSLESAPRDVQVGSVSVDEPFTPEEQDYLRRASSLEQAHYLRERPKALEYQRLSVVHLQSSPSQASAQTPHP